MSIRCALWPFAVGIHHAAASKARQIDRLGQVVAGAAASIAPGRPSWPWRNGDDRQAFERRRRGCGASLPGRPCPAHHVHRTRSMSGCILFSIASNGAAHFTTRLFVRARWSCEDVAHVVIDQQDGRPSNTRRASAPCAAWSGARTTGPLPPCAGTASFVEQRSGERAPLMMIDAILVQSASSARDSCGPCTRSPAGTRQLFAAIFCSSSLPCMSAVSIVIMHRRCWCAAAPALLRRCLPRRFRRHRPRSAAPRCRAGGRRLPPAARA